MDTKKRLSEWTLAECKEYCEKRKDKTPLEATDPKTGVTTTMWNYFCQDCELAYMCGCRPANWELDTLTDGEKSIMRACGAKWVTKNHADSALVELFEQKPYRKEGGYYDGKNCIGSLDSKLFPSVSGGDCIELED